MNNIDYLIISNTKDYSTDFICHGLLERGLSYLRINRDQFLEYDINLDIDTLNMTIVLDEKEYKIDKSLKAIYFRAPVFYRTMNREYSLDEQVYRSQWSSFIRNLVIYEDTKWINNPVDIYKSENKLYQLKIAKELGFKIPKSVVTNSNSIEHINLEERYVVKSIDTAFFVDEQEMFTYTNIVSGEEIQESNLKLAPVFIQQYVYPKIDIRVTIIGETIFAVKILDENKEGINYDWRKQEKEALIYEQLKLPYKIKSQLFNLMDKLKLNYGGVDLIKSDGDYYFIEINPTGEWGWLNPIYDMGISDAIINFMVGLENGKNI